MPYCHFSDNWRGEARASELVSEVLIKTWMMGKKQKVLQGERLNKHSRSKEGESTTSLSLVNYNLIALLYISQGEI